MGAFAIATATDCSPKLRPMGAPKKKQGKTERDARIRKLLEELVG